MGERQITFEQIEDCILNGDVVECNDFPDQDVCIVFKPRGRNDYYVVVAATLPCTIVTVCNPRPDCWILEHQTMMRRKK
jgi:hypothetical protein